MERNKHFQKKQICQYQMVGRVELVDIKVLVGELKVVVVEPAARIMKGFFFF